MKISVAGTGYVGLVTGVCLASKGHDVICVDVDKSKIERLRSGDPVIYEQDLKELMGSCIKSGKIKFTTDYKSAYADAEAIMISVGTPDRKDGSANMSYVYTVADEIAQSVERDCLVIVKSTVPVGTCEKIEMRIKDSLKHQVKIETASNPEFLSQGTAVYNTLHPERIIIGAKSEYAKNIFADIYAEFDAPKLIVRPQSSEMIKYASNDFLALKISYVNEIANLCEKSGADIEEVTKGMGYDPRIGSAFLKAGTGYGGSCFPKDTKCLHWLSNIHGEEIRTVRAAIDVNEKQKLILIRKAHEYYDSFYGVNIAVLGLTFKPGTDDLRESPSLSCVPYLIEDGANIKAWDPVGMDNFKKLYPNGVDYCDSIADTLKDADICFIFTEWPEIKNMDVSLFKEKMKAPFVFDGRNCFPIEKMKTSGAVYISIGREAVKK